MIGPATLERLAGLLGTDSRDLRARPLPGGLSNRSFLLTRGDDRWVVRLPRDAGMTPDPATEARVLALAAGAGLTPGVVACDADTGAIVTRYVAGATTWTGQRARRYPNIERIAATLRRLHSLPAPAGLSDFRPTELAQVYVDAAAGCTEARPCEPGAGFHVARPVRSPGARPDFANEQRRWGPEFKHLAQDYESEFGLRAICHNDLVAANILDDGRLWLIDFEYAVRADPVLDLAGLAGLNGFGPRRIRRLVNAYYGRESPSFSVARLNRVIRLVRLMAFFWSLSRSGEEASVELLRFAGKMASVLKAGPREPKSMR